MPQAIGKALAAYSPIERALLARRGIRSQQQAESFLARQYEGESDPYLMSGMQDAVERLELARREGQQVVVYGDYDADGITATALLFQALERGGLDARWYVPSRFEEGYGLNRDSIGTLADQGAGLIVSVDCGIRDREVVHGSPIDVIVTDHHLPGERLPAAVAVLNPHRDGDPYPFKGLSGVGIAFKLAQALLGRSSDDSVSDLLDLVAVGTVADLAPLQQENRQLVWQGLQVLREAARPGLRALAEFAGYGADTLDASAIGFGLGPRLNAAGRLSDAGEAVRLLLSQAGPEAWERASALDALNKDRQDLTNETLDRARELVDRELLAENLILAVDEGFHQGVVGLVASRLADESYRPALVGVREAGTIHGSARSIPEFHITEALGQCADLLWKFGGHARAAGFSLPAENLNAFSARIAKLAEERLGGLSLAPQLPIDAQLEFSELTEELMGFIDRLEPCGEANPYPTFETSGALVLTKRTVGARRRHLKLSLRQGGRVFDAIGFRLGDRLSNLPRMVDVVYRLERNAFRGVVSLQLNLLDLRPSHG